MITQEFLQSCTDEQINKGVAWLAAKKIPLAVSIYVPIRVYRDGAIFVEDGRYFHPCQVPNDAWPIITTSSISLKSDDEYDVDGNLVKQYVAYNGSDWRHEEYGKHRICGKNPLRAAMEVYILMSVKS